VAIQGTNPATPIAYIPSGLSMELAPQPAKNVAWADERWTNYSTRHVY